MGARFSKWTAAQSALATSDAAVSELTTKDDYWFAWDTVGRSFAGNTEIAGEPTTAWMLSAVEGFARGHEHFTPYVTFVTSIDRLPYVKSGGGFFATRDENGKIAAVIHAVKIRARSKPKPQHSTFSMILQSLTLGAAKRIPELVQSTDPALKDLFKRINDTMETRGKLLDNVPNKLHAKHGPAPHHYYVTIMAVEPTQQGKGHCGRLMRALHRIADMEGVPCWLDCGSDKNAAIYTKLGYKITEQVTIEAAPGDAITVYSMLRECGAGK